VDEEEAGTEILRRSITELAVDLSAVACMKNKSRLNQSRTCLLIFGSCCLVFQFVYNGMNIQQCRTVTLYDVLWACETCCLTVREEHGLRGRSGGDCIERRGTSDQVRKNEIGRAYDTFVG